MLLDIKKIPTQRYVCPELGIDFILAGAISVRSLLTDEGVWGSDKSHAEFHRTKKVTRNQRGLHGLPQVDFDR